MDFGVNNMVGKIESILIKRPEDAYISQENLEKNWEAYNYLGCPDFDKVVEEFKVFEQVLKDHIPNVYYLPKDDRAGIDSIYARDSLQVTDKGTIYLNMGKDLRKGEDEASEEYLKSIGVPTLGHIEAPETMEGGEILFIDEKTVAIGQGYRTTEAGIEQFRELTKDFIDEVISVPLPHANGEAEILHLTSLISMLDKDLAVVYSKYLPCFFRDLLIEKGIKLIEVNDKEYDYLGTNVLALAPRVCLVVEGVPEIKAAMEAEGCTVYTYPGHELSYRGMGGPTCLTHPIKRAEV